MDNYLQIITDKGVIGINKNNKIIELPIESTYKIANILVNNFNIPADKPYSFHSSGQNFLEIRLHFLLPELDLYKKKFAIIEGNQAPKWIAFSGNTFHYNNLPAGNYKVLINISNPANKMQNTKEILLTIKPRFWEKNTTKAIGITLIISLLLVPIWFLLKWQQQKKIKKILAQKHIEDLESKAFLNQLNPHFLFNALNTIQDYLITKDTHNGINYLQQLAGLSRNIIDFHKLPLITIEQESAFLKKYLFVQQKRFSEKFEYDIQFEQSIAEYKITPMMLQPIVENAIEHGLAGFNSGGKIDITFVKTANNIIVSIVDNGNGRLADFESLKQGHALAIIKERLDIIHKHNLNNQSLIFELNKPKGIITKLILPIQL